MNIRDRVLTALEWKMPDTIAFTPKPNHAYAVLEIIIRTVIKYGRCPISEEK